jgi:hypothetical protein
MVASIFLSGCGAERLLSVGDSQRKPKHCRSNTFHHFVSIVKNSLSQFLSKISNPFFPLDDEIAESRRCMQKMPRKPIILDYFQRFYKMAKSQFPETFRMPYLKVCDDFHINAFGHSKSRYQAKSLLGKPIFWESAKSTLGEWANALDNIGKQ